MPEFEQRRPLALFQIAGESGTDTFPIQSASIVLEINMPASAFVTMPASSKAATGQFQVKKRDFGEQVKISATGQLNYFTGQDTAASIIMEDGKGSLEFSGLISHISPKGSEASVQYALTSPITKLGSMSFNPLLSAAKEKGSSAVDTNNTFSQVMSAFSSFFDAADTFNGYNIYDATDKLYNAGVELAEKLELGNGAERQAFESTLANLKVGYELFKSQKDVFAGASINRPGLENLDNKVNRSGFFLALLPLWSSPSFLQHLLQQTFPKFQLQLSTVLSGGTITHLIEPVQIPSSPFSLSPGTLDQPAVDVAWSPGTVTQLPILCATLMGQKKIGGVDLAGQFVAGQQPYEMVASFPTEVTGRQGRVERYPAPEFFNNDIYADSSEEVKKTLKAVNTSPIPDNAEDFIASLKSNLFSPENIAKASEKFLEALDTINNLNANLLQQWAEVIFYSRILSGTYGQMRLPFTPNISIGRLYQVKTDGVALFTARVRKCTHTFRVTPGGGEASTVVDFDQILVDGVTLPS